MINKRKIIAVCLLLTVVMLMGCVPKRRLYSDFIPDQAIAEDMIVTTEFPEYDGNAIQITLFVTNNGSEDFCTGEKFFLEKKENGEWHGIAVTGAFRLLAHIYPSSTSDLRYTADLKDHVLQPLPSGTYRIGISTAAFADSLDYENGKIAYSNEFTIK